jgi:hypothetical protein
MSNKDSQPKAHLYDKANKTRKDLSFFVFYSDGQKVQLSLEDLRSVISDNNLTNELLDKLKENKISKKDILNTISEKEVITFGKILNVLGNEKIEEIVKDVGCFYTNGDVVRIKLNNGWKTLKVE